ncbi:MAG: AAA domain-containing protein [Proteobacteria bacterium]|nr:AAA domain-containing protein [Pseudomonadota bacterium]
MDLAVDLEKKSAPDLDEGIEKIHKLVAEVEKVIVGQTSSICRIVVALLADGHVLLEGVPGLAKTLLVSALGSAMGAVFQRIQMVPDMLPSDLIGTYLLVGNRFKLQKGPLVDCHVALVDEINRAPAKTQAALLQAMQERQVTVMGKDTLELPDPFIVLATQNPVEQDGTYPLPEAQLDRFIFKVLVGYPSPEHEMDILTNVNLDQRDKIKAVNHVLEPSEICQLRETIKKEVSVEHYAHKYIVDLVRATRFPGEFGLKSLEGCLKLGASPRATMALRDAARVEAFLHNRRHVYPEDIQAVARDVFRHRICLEFSAEAEGLTVETVMQEILCGVHIP